MKKLNIIILSLLLASVQAFAQTSVPTVHNPKLDNALRKYIESPEDKEYIDDIINTACKNNGTFLGSALMQHEINFQHLYAFMSGNTDILIKNNINPTLGKTIKGFGEAFYKTVKPEEESVSNWVLNKYRPVLYNNLKYDHKPTAEEVCIRLDDIARTKAGFDQKELASYYIYCDDFVEKGIKRKKDTQSMSDLIAYKMFLIDKTLFRKELSGIGVFSAVGRFEYGDKTIYHYYKDWMDSVEPKGN